MTTSSITGQPAGNFDWDALTLDEGSHYNGETDDCGNPLLCFMEALNASRGLGVTDTCPDDVSLTLHGFIINLNDALGTVDRQRLKPYRDRISGTGGQPDADERAAYMCVDWLIRTYTPAFLRLAGLGQHADAFAGASEIIDLATLDQVDDCISAADSVARSSAYPLRSTVAGSAVRSVADSAADSAAYWAADSAAGSVAGDSATYSVAGSVAACSAAVCSAAGQDFAPTVAALQASAFGLLDRMIAAYTVAAV